MSTEEHKQEAPNRVTVGIITVSTTRTLQTDKTGQWMKKRAKKERHDVTMHRVVADDEYAIQNAVQEAIQKHQPGALILTGGTGISPKDVTIEAIRPLFDKELTGFGAIFTQLSFEQIDSAAILSRAMAGVIGQTILFCIPGSLNACKLACKALIFPELGHLVKHLQEV